MFFKRTDIKNGDIVMGLDVVSCTECKCLVNKSDAQAIQAVGLWSSNTLYYCRKDKKPYDRVGWGISLSKPKTVYYAELEVSEDGTPTGYRKIKK